MREREGNGRGREMLGGLGVIKKGKGSCRVLGGQRGRGKVRGEGRGEKGLFYLLSLLLVFLSLCFFFFSLLS